MLLYYVWISWSLYFYVSGVFYLRTATLLKQTNTACHVMMILLFFLLLVKLMRVT